MAWISAVFFCLGAADTLLGDRLGLGSAFRQGFAAVVDLLLLMTGFMGTVAGDPPGPGYHAGVFRRGV